MAVDKAATGVDKAATVHVVTGPADFVKAALVKVALGKVATAVARAATAVPVAAEIAGRKASLKSTWIS